MEILQRMNDCMEYIEGNLQEKIELDQLALISLSSKFHFQRMFHMVTGFTVADYIRRRRLTLAAQDLMNADTKVIDVALRYQYETPESFSKAFRKVHGVSPSAVRESGASLKAFPRMSFQIQLKGEKEMEYKVVERESFKVIGKGTKIRTSNEENNKEIPMFWNEVTASGEGHEICRYAGNEELMGVCMAFDHGGDTFSYLIGAETTEESGKFDSIVIPASTWAVFTSVGPMPHAIQEVWQRIYSEWFPSTGYEHGGGPEFELYPPGNVNEEDYRCEVWIPIKKK
ncbi:AraC family transcriptional regulator [Rossellomorea aquimaris]|uniref:AraC family transcriptional regulator n=1 Tax=Rossellomorea aquimaris TaxID=189382 RepID=UPI001CD429FC|nr:AraC family transcriptional regulator [Rossellomorea aquimaris]MCA1055685.1 AraC family transcriptional regulator [Rossellomorea aquimaris]